MCQGVLKAQAHVRDSSNPSIAILQNQRKLHQSKYRQTQKEREVQTAKKLRHIGVAGTGHDVTRKIRLTLATCRFLGFRVLELCLPGDELTAFGCPADTSKQDDVPRRIPT